MTRMSVKSAIVLLVCSLVPFSGSSFASTNIVRGTFETEISGWDSPAIQVVDEGGEIRYLRMKTFRYPDYSANPMYQDIGAMGHYYDPAITTTEDCWDEDNNLYRNSFWGTPADPYPGTITERLYILDHYCPNVSQRETIG